MKNIKTFLEFINENINVPVKVGDTILRGRFKNVKIKIKKIGKDKKEQPIINGKNVLTFRLLTKKQQKEQKKKEKE